MYILWSSAYMIHVLEINKLLSSYCSTKILIVSYKRTKILIAKAITLHIGVILEKYSVKW